jgi:hypothetical protein
LATITVNVAFDESDGFVTDGDASLRDAIAVAVAGDTINFASSLNDATLPLTLGQIAFGKNLTIDASMLSSGVTIDAGDTTAIQGDGIRIFNITDPTFGSDPPLVTLKNLKFTRADSSGAGGAINSAAQLDVQDCKFIDNESTLIGGAIAATFAGGVLRVSNTQFIQNKSGEGGAVRIDVSSGDVDLIGCVFDTNESGQGGGMFASLSDTSLDLNGTIFVDNTIGNGGGLHVQMFGASTLHMDQGTFTDNTANAGGGAFFAIFGGSATVSQSTFKLNHATSLDGGGLFTTMSAGTSLAVVDSIVSDNDAVNGGGLLIDMGPDAAANGTLFSLTRTQLKENTATRNGGGMLLGLGFAAEATLEDSVITGNEAGLTRSGQGHVIYDAGGGVYAFLTNDANFDPTLLTITGTEITENHAGSNGGGVAICSKRVATTGDIRLAVQNSTISGNDVVHSTTAPGKGGGVLLAVYDEQSSDYQALDSRFANVTITNNKADQGGGIWSSVPSASHSVNDVRLANTIVSQNQTPSSSNSNLFGSFNITDTVFNIIGTDNSPTIALSLQPTFDHVSHQRAALKTFAQGNNQFTDSPGLGQLQNNGGLTRTHALSNNSVARDAGSNALAVIPFTSTLLETDQRGEMFVRPFDLAGVGGTTALGTSVDIGAYEIGIPKVIDVTISKSGASQTLNPDHHFAADNEIGPTVGTGRQLATVPVGGADTVSITFSEDVSTTNLSSSFAIRGMRYGFVPTPSATTPFNYDPTTHVATWKFQPPSGGLISLATDHYLISLADAITDVYGNHLDGDWKNPGRRYAVGSGTEDFTNSAISTFPSGDGSAGGAFNFLFTIFGGDATLDNWVDGADYLILQQFYSDTSAMFVEADFTGDGTVNSNDFSLLSMNYGRNMTLFLWADFNGDGAVTGSGTNNDYAIWQLHYGMTSGATHADGDADLDGDVDGADFNIWQQQQGLSFANFVVLY